MGLFTRRERPPSDLVAGLRDDERVLAWADTSDGSVVVATSHGLWWPFETGPRCISWANVDKVVWRDGVISVTEADVVDDFLVERDPVMAVLSVPRDLPPAVRKRVDANILRTELLRVGGGAVRFVSRRRPGSDGVVWWARLEPGTPATDQVRSAVRARLALLRAGDEGSTSQ